jgi:hypothetical protein
MRRNPMTDRKKPGVAFWATVAVVAVLLYVASFGPACWIARSNPALVMPVTYFYWPLTWVALKSPNRLLLDALFEYGNWGKPSYELSLVVILRAWEPD